MSRLFSDKPGLFILGGSTYYTLLLIDSLCSKEQGFCVAEGLSRITLFGRHQARLALMADMCQQLVNKVDETIVVDTSTHIEDCLQEQYGMIFNQIRFGGMSSRDQDEKIALQHDLAADETIGIVGVSNAIRAVHGMTEYLEVIKRKSNPYRLINFTNPCSILTQYMREFYQLPVIGICDYPQMMKTRISAALNCDLQDVEMGYFGLNHFGMVHSVKAKGEEQLARLLTGEFDAQLPFKPECNQFFDTLLNVSWRYVFEHDEVVKEQQSKTNRAAQLLQFEESMDGLLRDGVRDPQAYFDILSQRHCDWFNLVVAPLFANVLQLAKKPIIANVPVPDNADVLQLGISACVQEGLCDSSNMQLEMPDLPESVLRSQEFALIRQMKMSERALLSGILARCSKSIIAACLINPMLREQSKVLAYFRELSQQDAFIHSIFSADAKMAEALNLVVSSKV